MAPVAADNPACSRSAATHRPRRAPPDRDLAWPPAAARLPRPARRRGKPPGFHVLRQSGVPREVQSAKWKVESANKCADAPAVSRSTSLSTFHFLLSTFCLLLSLPVGRRAVHV